MKLTGYSVFFSVSLAMLGCGVTTGESNLAAELNCQTAPLSSECNIETRLKVLIADQIQISSENIRPEVKLREDLNFDDLDMVELINDIEREFNIFISEDDEPALRTVQDLINYIKARI